MYTQVIRSVNASCLKNGKLSIFYKTHYLCSKLRSELSKSHPAIKCSSQHYNGCKFGLKLRIVIFEQPLNGYPTPLIMTCAYFKVQSVLQTLLIGNCFSILSAAAKIISPYTTVTFNSVKPPIARSKSISFQAQYQVAFH